MSKIKGKYKDVPVEHTSEPMYSEQDMEAKDREIKSLQIIIQAAKEDNARLVAEIERLKSCCVIEAMEANQNVNAYIGQCEKEIEQLKAELDRLKDLNEDIAAELERIKQDPDSYISEYQDRLSVQIDAGHKMSLTIDRLNTVNKQLREGLRRLRYQWHPNFTNVITGSDSEPPIILGYMKCVGCDAWVNCATNEYKLPDCKPDCWLAKLLEGRE